MILLRNFKNVFLIPELLKKLLFTLGVIVVFRIGSFIPVVGINVPLLASYMDRAGAAGGLLGYLDVISGGSLQRCTLFALGIGPYISSSIIMQLMSMTVPYFERMIKEGDYGYKLLNQYTRYLTFALSVMYSLTYATFLERAGLVLNPGMSFRIVFVLSLTLGSMFVMWLGEQISMMGVGNGSSMLIFSGIVARFPDYLIKTVDAVQQGNMHIFVAIFVLIFFMLVTACIVFLEKGDRKIPVQYARRVVGRKVYGGQSTYIPFKINTAGVMPAIFAQSILQVPLFLLQMLAGRFVIAKTMLDHFSYTGFLFNLFQFALIVFFTFFYTELVYNPDKLSEQMKKNGGFIPGIRPGKSTADYFYYILTRVGLVGALYLGMLSIMPNVLLMIVPGLPFYIGGTSLLIVVGVALEFASQVESYLIERNYKGFLTTGQMKNRVA